MDEEVVLPYVGAVRFFIYVKDSKSLIWWFMYAEVLICDSAICVEYGVRCFLFFFE